MRLMVDTDRGPVECPEGVRFPRVPARPSDDRRHIAVGFGWVSNPDGSVAWEQDGWQWNAVIDEGEADGLNTWFRGVAITSKYLVLIDGRTTAPTETDTMAYLGGGAQAQEVTVPTTNGYARPQVATGDWNAPALNSGDMQIDMAAAKTFGPNTGGAAWVASHAGMVTAATGQLSGSGKFLLFLALAGNTTINIGQSFNYLLKAKLS